ncbi:MAG: GFA family protein [Kiloniellales bacterium]|nr:GFA family protein [Kiloniellales bacterium]
MKGGCLCGTIRYEISGEPLGMHHCHCHQCRRASGASFATTMVVRAADFDFLQGEEKLAAYESTPGKQRTFCGRCGSPIYSRYDDNPGFINLRSGTLDGDPGARPSLHIHVASRAPWIEITDNLPQSREEEGLAF